MALNGAERGVVANDPPEEWPERLQEALDLITEKEKEIINRCIKRNVLFWIEVALPTLALIANLVLIFVE